MQGREILLGVTGGIAAYKAAALTSQLVQAGARVSVVLTPAGAKFVGPATFEALTGRHVFQSLFEESAAPLGAHIELARRAELAIVAPATANFLAELAHGLAGDLLTTTLLAFTGPVLLAPAMNAQMWGKPSVQRNVGQLRADGYRFVDPGEGWLSCRETGAGRMAEPAELFDAIAAAIESQTGPGPARV